MSLTFKDQKGRIIGATRYFDEHMRAHNDISIFDIQEVLSQVDIKAEEPVSDGNIVVDRVVSRQGVCALVEDPVFPNQLMLFGFRKGRTFPTRMSDKPGMRTNLIRVVIRPVRKKINQYAVCTAYWARKEQAGIEPLDPSINPRTLKGQDILKRAIRKWSIYALSERCTELDGDSFWSTWSAVLKDNNYPCPPFLRFGGKVEYYTKVCADEAYLQL